MASALVLRSSDRHACLLDKHGRRVTGARGSQYGLEMRTLRVHWPHVVSLVVSLLALVVAVNGPAVATGVARAAAQIPGKQIKNGSVEAKDLSKAARATLRGQQGPPGPQ